MKGKEDTEGERKNRKRKKEIYLTSVMQLGVFLRDARRKRN